MAHDRTHLIQDVRHIKCNAFRADPAPSLIQQDDPSRFDENTGGETPAP